MLSIKNITKRFGQKTVLNDVSLSVERGHIAVMLGASGVGKSTLLRVLNNLETIDSGTVELNGKLLDLNTVNKTHIIGMVFQHFYLFEQLTAQENIMLPLQLTTKTSVDKARVIAHELLERYGLGDKIDAYPAQLSGGQKQRLAIARSIALKPQVICLDEPTSALDPLLTTYVAQNIQQLAKDGYIVLVASHDIALVERLDCSINLMENGKIVESTTSAQFNANKAAYPKLARFIAGDIS